MVIVNKTDTPPKGKILQYSLRSEVDTCISDPSVRGPNSCLVVSVEGHPLFSRMRNALPSHNTTMQPNYQVSLPLEKIKPH